MPAVHTITDTQFEVDIILEASYSKMAGLNHHNVGDGIPPSLDDLPVVLVNGPGHADVVRDESRYQPIVAKPEAHILDRG